MEASVAVANDRVRRLEEGGRREEENLFFCSSFFFQVLDTDTHTRHKEVWNHQRLLKRVYRVENRRGSSNEGRRLSNDDTEMEDGDVYMFFCEVWWGGGEEGRDGMEKKVEKKVSTK